MTDIALKQDDLDAILFRGLLFSFLWLAGLGSVYAFWCGLRARRAINNAGGALVGRGRAWWCLIVGGLGMAIWLPIITVGILNNLR